MHVSGVKHVHDGLGAAWDSPINLIHARDHGMQGKQLLIDKGPKLLH